MSPLLFRIGKVCVSIVNADAVEEVDCAAVGTVEEGQHLLSVKPKVSSTHTWTTPDIIYVNDKT